MEPVPSEHINSSEPEYAAAPQAVASDTGVAPKAAASDAARRMGQARTEAKQITARQNGRRGGRPQGYKVSEETRQKISQTKKQNNTEKQNNPKHKAEQSPLPHS